MSICDESLCALSSPAVSSMATTKPADFRSSDLAGGDRNLRLREARPPRNVKDLPDDTGNR